MSYPDDLCRLVLNNLNLLEDAPSIIGEIESVMFKAINARLEARVSALDGWSGTFDLVLDNDSGETKFAPQSLAESGVFYMLDETGDDTEYWPSTALGLRNSRLCLKIIPDPKLRERPKQKGPRLLSRIHAETDAFHQHHIDFDAPSGAFYVPFILEADKVIAEYPNLSDSLVPVEWAFDNMLAAHEHFERIAKGELGFYETENINGE